MPSEKVAECDVDRHKLAGPGKLAVETVYIP